MLESSVFIIIKCGQKLWKTIIDEKGAVTAAPSEPMYARQQRRNTTVHRSRLH